jgi:peptide/nickel transport system ATP-binding protein
VSNEKPLLEVDDLHVTFVSPDRTVHAVNGVSFSVERGEALGILGESGSGKSVTLRSILRLLPPERTHFSGAIRLEGSDVLSMPERALADLRGSKVAMIFQEPATSFDPVYTIGRQIAETIMRHEGTGESAAWRRARELLEMVKIPSAERRLKAYPHEMSGGMRQRAMIALALSCRPSLLLADEPTTALDATVQIQVLLLIRELQRELGLGVIFVTHDIGVAVEVSNRIGVMYAGKLVEIASVEELVDHPLHPYTQGLLGSTVHGAMRGRRLDAIPGAPPSLSAAPDGCSFEPRCKLATTRCIAAVPALTEIGAQHSARCIHAGNSELAHRERPIATPQRPRPNVAVP